MTGMRTGPVAQRSAPTDSAAKPPPDRLFNLVEPHRPGSDTRYPVSSLVGGDTILTAADRPFKMSWPDACLRIAEPAVEAPDPDPPPRDERNALKLAAEARTPTGSRQSAFCLQVGVRLNHPVEFCPDGPSMATPYPTDRFPPHTPSP